MKTELEDKSLALRGSLHTGSGSFEHFQTKKKTGSRHDKIKTRVLPVGETRVTALQTVRTCH